MVNWAKISGSAFKYFGLRSGKKAAQVAEQTPEIVQKATRRMTRSSTDPLTGFETLEREITYGGKEALCRIERMPGGVSKISITGGGDNDMWRVKTITREKGGGVFGGDKVTIQKKDTKYWCYDKHRTLVKEYNKDGGLEHKELSFSHSSGNGLNDYSHKAVQDRVYNEYPLSSSADDMLKSPYENRYIKHSLDGKDNYGKFADGNSTYYTRAVAAREQAAIDAAKKAEAEAAAAKAAEEKAAAELKARQPRINIGKAFGRDINELTVKETTLANGTVERTFTDPKTGEILAKTQDLGIGHKEWIYGAKGTDVIYMSQVGKDTPYILAKKGNYTQIRKPVFDEKFRLRGVDDTQYYYDGIRSYKTDGGYGGELKMPYNETPWYKTESKEYQELQDRQFRDNNRVRLADRECYYYAEGKVRPLLNEMAEEAKKERLDLEYLFSEYKA